MKNVTISIIQYCEYHKIEPQFLIDLHQNDLVILKERNHEYFIDEEDLTKVEKYTEFYYNLGINLEGIEVISHLLEQIESLQKKLNN